MRKTVLITADVLQQYYPCRGGLRSFNNLFPRGVTISNSQEEMIELLLKLERKLSDIDFNALLTVLRWFIQESCDGWPVPSSEVHLWRCVRSLVVEYDDIATLACLLSDSELLA